MSEKKLFMGYISEHSHGEGEALFISGLHDPLAEELYFISNKQVTARYWISDKKCSKDDAITGVLNEIEGLGVADFFHRYSEYTGYLWTDEDLNIGGHDLIEELRSHIDKWLILEIEVR